jgi:hypothetical protein
MSRVLLGKRAELEIASLEIGAQIEARRLPLLGITYDPKDNIIEITLDGLDHLVYEPRELYVDDQLDGLVSLEIIGSDGAQRIVILRDPLMLPRPGED